MKDTRASDEPTASSPSNTPRDPALSEATFTEGSTFGPFVLGPRIGSGGMARVFQAEHRGLLRQVAIKVLIDGFAPDMEQRFLREARIAAAIKHPNVVNIFDVGLHQGLPYLVMELLEGEDLEGVLASKGCLDQEMLIDLMVPIVAGLAAVHDAGIVHRDLKPGNIFLARGKNGEIEPKLLDFGISKAAWPEPSKLTSANGVVLGTPFYMSPEAVQGKEMTALSDQYALGVVMYECATGNNPFVASSFPETVRLITLGDYPPVAHLKPELSRRLGRIIERAMSVEPSQRYTDMRELGRELLQLAGQRTRVTWGLSFGDPRAMARQSARASRAAISAPAQSSPPPPLVTTPRPKNPKKSLRTGLFAATALGVLALGLALGPRRRPPLEAPAPTLQAARIESTTHALERSSRAVPRTPDNATAPVASPAPTPATPAAPLPTPAAAPMAAPAAPAAPLPGLAAPAVEPAAPSAAVPAASPAREASEQKPAPAPAAERRRRADEPRRNNGRAARPKKRPSATRTRASAARRAPPARDAIPTPGAATPTLRDRAGGESPIVGTNNAPIFD